MNESEENSKSNLLNELRQKKKSLEDYYRSMDNQITNLEAQYLDNTVNIGNVIKGWEHVLVAKSKIPTQQQINPTNKKVKFSIQEKIFSQSSFPLFKKEDNNIANNKSKIFLLNLDNPQRPHNGHFHQIDNKEKNNTRYFRKLRLKKIKNE